METEAARENKKELKRMKRALRHKPLKSLSSGTESSETEKSSSKPKLDFSNAGKPFTFGNLAESNDEQTIVHPMIEYLYKWKEDRANWKFKKAKQTLLLQYLYDPRILTKDDFKIMLEYLGDLKGSAREDTLKMASEIDQKIPFDIEGDDLISQRKRIAKCRALQIMSVLKN